MSTSASPFPNSAATDTKLEQTMERLADAAGRKAQFWTAVVVLLHVLLYLGGVLAVFFASLSEGYPWLAIPLAMAMAAIAIDAARHHREAESLQRRFESWLVTGQALTTEQLEAFRRRLPKKRATEIDQWLEEAALLPVAPQQSGAGSLAILSERTWLNHRYAAFCAKKLEFAFWLMLGVALALLVFSAVTLSASGPGTGAAKCIGAALLFGLTGAGLRAWQGCHVFSLRCREINQEAAHLGKSDAPAASEIQRVWSEFQLARAAAPLMHPLLRRFNQAQLEDEFQSFLRDGERWRDPKTGRYLDSLDADPEA